MFDFLFFQKRSFFFSGLQWVFDSKRKGGTLMFQKNLKQKTHGSPIFFSWIEIKKKFLEIMFCIDKCIRNVAACTEKCQRNNPTGECFDDCTRSFLDCQCVCFPGEPTLCQGSTIQAQGLRRLKRQRQFSVAPRCRLVSRPGEGYPIAFADMRPCGPPSCPEPWPQGNLRSVRYRQYY